MHIGDIVAKLKDFLIVFAICFIGYLAGRYLTDGDKLLTVLTGCISTLGTMAGVAIGRASARSSDNNNQPNGGKTP